jgi:predicted acetyltransferase
VVEWPKAGTHLAAPSKATGRVRLLDPDAARKVLPGVYEAYRRSCPGALSRNERWWDSYLSDPEKFRDGYSNRYYAVHENDGGEADGYAAYRIGWGNWTPEQPGSTLRLLSIHTDDPEVEAALFEFLLNVDLVHRIDAHCRPVDDQLRWRLDDFRRYRIKRTNDWLWLRLVDIPGALSARRYSTDDVLTIQLTDPFRPANEGVYRLEGGPNGASCTPADGSTEADLRLPIDALGAAYLGGVSFTTLAAAGRAAGDREALVRADAMFRSVPHPFCDRDF